MNPIERALGILLLMTGGKLVPATYLAERFQVSLRTIYRDIDRLIALGVPVDAERGAEGGYRLASGYLQPPVALTRNETAALLSAMALSRSSRTVPLADDLASAEKKLLASLPKAVHGLLKQADRIVGIEPLPADIFHSGTKADPSDAWQLALDGFMCGILESKRVRFDHVNPARKTVKAHDVEPYGIMFDRDLWYLAGRCVDTGVLKVYRADRVRQLEISGLFFRPDKMFSVQTLLGGAWLSDAMRRWEQEEAIAKILITPAQARKLSADWYYRHAVFTPAGEDKILISIPSTDRGRILPLVRWLGPGAELLEPMDLRQDLAEELDALSTLYREAPAKAAAMPKQSAEKV
ncbi:YafY family transcriptional regulator [Roseibium denhamense]|uniref:Predicted DNA-binding transcriptional regulator YafY, contains an HTH and WYL domains n=1 Tax=Roseibium denhamense TaxID=76305 RepID=A0ABY1PIH0_9HYPH|nr:YafY family protein [Roseibium denhamense]MTI05533.1 YafY family transcriptional regulator [Roseibium denhamense]SMP35144.1 Predicted DNA-binding transcriptional regulator YafY, contains an HTH and WYL domains [Roseibium denhamense]